LLRPDDSLGASGARRGRRLPYDKNFEMGASLSEAAATDGGNFERGEVKLNHPHYAKFCVLGGGSCSG